MKRMFAITLVALGFLVGANQAQATSTNSLNFNAALDQTAAPDRFPNTEAGLAACEKAVRTGNFKPYVPSFTNDRRAPRAGETPRPLEENACVRLKIVGGRKMFVPQLKGEMYFFNDKGECTVREDCGNDCDKIVYIIPPAPEPVAVEPTPAPAAPASNVTVQPFKVDLSKSARTAEPAATTPVPTCGDVKATNYGEALPCRFAPASTTTTREHRADSGLVLTFGVEYTVGRFGQEYTDPIPDRGDVPQRHPFSILSPYVRVDQSRTEGLFLKGAMSAAGSDGTMEFQAIDGWNAKRRDQDNSKDKMTKVVGGYKFPLSDNLSVGPYLGYSRWCVCESYTAQGANTVTQLVFSGVVVGGELAGNVRNRTTITVSGEFGPSLQRKSWTHQTYGSINFPRVDHPEEKAKSFGFRAALEQQLVGGLHATGAFDYLGVSSVRPENFAAKEKTSRNAITIGVAYKWGK